MHHSGNPRVLRTLRQIAILLVLILGSPACGSTAEPEQPPQDSDTHTPSANLSVDAATRVVVVEPSATPSLAPSTTPNPPKATATPLSTHMSKADPSGAAQFLRDQSIAPTPHAASGPRGILFVSTQDGVANIYLINEDGTEQVRLTQNGRNNLSPGWSPDGRQIALLSSEVGAESITYHLYMMDSEGIEPADITPLLDQSVESLAWSPDGQRIALVANPAPEEGTFAGTNVFVANKDGSTLTQITHMDSGTVGCWSPIWAPDGSKLVFICRALMQVAIEIANADGLDRWNYEYGQVSQVFLLPSGEHVGFAGGICSSLGVFSIEFLLTHGASSAGPWPCLDQDLEALGVDLTSPYEVSWSPLVDTQFAIQTTQSLYIIDLARYAVNVVRFESKRLNGPPSWAPNGDRIAFAAEGGNDSEIYVLNLVNNEVVQLTDNEVDDTMPAWRP